MRLLFIAIIAVIAVISGLFLVPSPPGSMQYHVRSVVVDQLINGARVFGSFVGTFFLPKLHGVEYVDGIDASVRIVRDKWGIPHIYGNSSRDTVFGQGYVHAQDRLMQMEVLRRAASGRLSELIGAKGIPTDRLMRTLQIQHKANELAENLKSKSSDAYHKVYKPYVDGFNAYLQSENFRKPIELYILNMKDIEPLQVEQSIAMVNLICWQLSRGWGHELTRGALAGAVGKKKLEEIDMIISDPQIASAIPDGPDMDKLLKMFKDNVINEGIKHSENLPKGDGSNAWAVLGRKSKNGHPLVASDPHLTLTTPSIWYMNHLKSKKPILNDTALDVIGATIPGMPLVPTGHNGYVGWGDTLSLLDCGDFFIEKFKDNNINSHQYLHKGEWKKAQILQEDIKIKGGDVEKINITNTLHGPIISDVMTDKAKRTLPDDVQYHLAFSSVPLRIKTDCMEYIIKAMVSKNVHELRESFRGMESPSMAVVAGDVEGNVGYQMTGDTPIRRKGDGSLPVPGWTGEYDWEDMIPYDALPSVINPEQGFTVAANHLPVPRERYPYELGRSFMNGERGTRIAKILSSQEKFNIDDFKQLQNDTRSRFGYEFAKIASSFATQDSDARLAQQYLLNWDGDIRVDSVAASIYEESRHCMVRNLIRPTLSKELRDSFLGENLLILGMTTEYNDLNTAGFLNLLRNESSVWTKEVGGRNKLLEQSMAEAINNLRTKLGPNHRGWEWGKLHKLSAPHMFKRASSLLDKIFSFPLTPTSGDIDTIRKMSFKRESNEYTVSAFSVSLRLLFDFSDLSKSVGVFLPGQSGRLGSKYYDNLGKLFIKNEYIPLSWKDEDVEKNKENELVLKVQA